MTDKTTIQITFKQVTGDGRFSYRVVVPFNRAAELFETIASYQSEERLPVPSPVRDVTGRFAAKQEGGEE